MLWHSLHQGFGDLDEAGSETARGPDKKEERWSPLTERASLRSPAPRKEATSERPGRLVSPSPLNVILGTQVTKSTICLFALPQDVS
jgi:hypothetical protein